MSLAAIEAIEVRITKGLAVLRDMEEAGKMETRQYRSWFFAWQGLLDDHYYLMSEYAVQLGFFDEKE